MKYLKVFSDFAEAIETLSDAEAGRLFRAMLLYAKTDEEPSIVGNERFIWPIAKMNIDRQRDEYKTKCSINQENGKKGGRPKPKETQENRLGFSETQNNPEEPKKSQDKDKDKDKDKEYINPPISPLGGKGGGFVKPSVEEVKAYCQERGNSVDPEAFVAFYESNGWKVGKNPMKNWKSAVITWEKSRKEGSRGRSSENKPVYEPSRVYHSPDAELPEGWHYDN